MVSVSPTGTIYLQIVRIPAVDENGIFIKYLKDQYCCAYTRYVSYNTTYIIPRYQVPQDSSMHSSSTRYTYIVLYHGTR